ncbi:hypothetical protein [Hoeflea sp.]|uniref:hypothetical protein n=1 Tax=Hoeflea sp. TaxID=1940281 RepID=UPI003A90C271
MQKIGILSGIFLFFSLASCNGKERSFTLYRNSVLDESMRIHIATFDAKAGSAYNEENCDIAADLFQSQPGVTVRYWCEPGLYRE